MGMFRMSRLDGGEAGSEFGLDATVAEEKEAFVEAFPAQPAGDLVVALTGVAGGAGGDDVGERVASASGEREDAVAVEGLRVGAAIGAAAPGVLERLPLLGGEVVLDALHAALAAASGSGFAGGGFAGAGGWHCSQDSSAGVPPCLGGGRAVGLRCTVLRTGCWRLNGDRQPFRVLVFVVGEVRGARKRVSPLALLWRWYVRTLPAGGWASDGTVMMLLRLALVSMLAFPVSAAITLYDDSLGTLPGAQPWLIFGQDSFLSGGTFSQTLVGSGVRLVSDNAVSAGYSNYLPVVNTFKNAGFPVLDRAAGFALSFQLLVNAEAHANANRAGFSVILLANDRQGIELGFWGNEIWAQSGAAFTHAEGVAFDTTSAEVDYVLSILGSTYVLSANGVPVLNGGLRDYSSFGTPYSLPNFVFLGDDTSSAGADVSLGMVTLTAAPEPGSLGLLALGLAGWLVRRRC